MVRPITVTTVTTDDASGNPGDHSFGNLLIDEDQNGDNVGSEPVHTISVDLTQAALNGYKSTLIDQGGNDRTRCRQSGGRHSQTGPGSN